MRVAVLSDLHLASSAAPCAFRHDLDAFRRFLDHVYAHSDAIVLAGDVFDTDLAPRPYGQRDELDAARADWAPLLGHLRDMDAQSVVGNHDRLLGESGTPELLTIEAAGRRLTVLHGHQFYPASAALEQIKYPVKWLAGRLEARGRAAASLGRLLHTVNDTVSTPHTGHSVTGRGALRWLRRHPGVDFVVCGHEHVTERVASPWGTYANSGTCGFGRLDWVLVDMDRGAVDIHSGEN